MSNITTTVAKFDIFSLSNQQIIGQIFIKKHASFTSLDTNIYVIASNNKQYAISDMQYAKRGELKWQIEQ